MTIAAYLAACEQIANGPYYYDNSVPSRCNPHGFGRDCSTFVAFALIAAGYPNINACGNSYYFAAMCHDEPRPDWFTEKFGPGVGTFISHDQALWNVSWGFRGSDFGRAPDLTGDGHIETSLGNGGGSVGAHSHATGIGYSTFDVHNLSYYAIPPHFLAELAPPVWKVQPNMIETLHARLRNPQGGWWEGYADGRVDFLKNNGQIVHGGMVTPEDKRNFEGRTLAQLKLRWYHPRGAIRRKAGYTIVATSGEMYEPTPQH